MSTNAIVARGGAAVIAAAAMIGGTGCEATLHTPGAVIAYDTGDYVVRADVVPPDIWAYPRVYYGGTYAYLVGGRWYYPSRRGWMVMRREPVELGRQRTRIYASPQYRRSYRAPAYGYPNAGPPRYREYPP